MSYDAVVMGLGSSGSSVLYHLVRKGFGKVLGIDARCPGCGQTSRSSAIVRLHYTNPVTRDMAIYSWRFWMRFREETGYEREVYHVTGVGFAGSGGDTKYVEEVVRSLRSRGIDAEIIPPDKFKLEYFPEINVDDIDVVAWEPLSGYCDAYDSVQGFIKYAVTGGAEVRYPEEIIRLEAEGDTILKIVTNKGVYKADYFINTLGVWTNKVLRTIGVTLPIQPAREDVLYISMDNPPGFGWGDLNLGFYGRPDTGSRYLIGGLEPDYKVEASNVEPGEYSTPPLEILRSRLERASIRFPSMASAAPISMIYGYYDVTPDHQPIISIDPRYKNLIHLVGLSGHGFKLAPAFGDTVTDIILYGESRRFPLEQFRATRFREGVDASGRYKYGILG